MAKIYQQKEINCLIEGGKKLAQVVEQLKIRIRPGVSGKQLDGLAYTLIKQAGGRPSFLNHQGYCASTCISVNSEVVHSVPTSRKFKQGDVVGLDIGMYYRGFHTDMAVTVAVGKISPKIAEFIRVAKLALIVGITKSKPGNTTGDIGNAIQNTVESKGYSVVRELSGHGVGKKLHEEPTIPNYGVRGEGKKLFPGMVIAIEPIINLGKREVETDIDGWRVKTKDKSISAHFEHTIIITEKGNKILTKI